MPEPLVCEDTSLTRLMETVNQTPGARILYQDTVRRGGVFGFFAREVHRVAYLAEQPSQDVERPSRDEPAAAETDPIAGLLAAAEAAEARLRRTAGAEHAEQAEHAESDFAGVLRRYVSELEVSESEASKSEVGAQEVSASELAESELQPTVTEPIGPTAIKSNPGRANAEVTPFGGRGRNARNRLELLMQLRQIGVPISINPAGTVHSPYEALEDILQQLPAPARLPSGAGQLIVLVGDGAAAVRAARTVSRMLRLPLRSIVAAGVETGVGGSLRRISSPQEAIELRAELVTAATPSVLVVATDGTGLGPDDAWPAEMIAALRPDAVWAVVDARWKPEDSRAQLDRLPRTDALVVHSAALSGSPASVWELELPIGLVDDRRPYNFIWLGMLIRLVGDQPRQRATA
jgi:hypothetical protein